jgi:hypothetical protein
MIRRLNLVADKDFWGLQPRFDKYVKFKFKIMSSLWLSLCQVRC